MHKRVLVFFGVMITGFCIGALRVHLISCGETTQKVAAQNSSYSLNIANYRGNIYDYKLRPLLYKKKETAGIVFPENFSQIKTLLKEDQLQEYIRFLKQYRPFVVKIQNDLVEVDNKNLFNTTRRYSEDQILSHFIGYTNDVGKGVCGAEKAFDDYLDSGKGRLCVRYKVDAIGRPLDGENVTIEDTTYKKTRGVVLTIDEKIQEIVETVGQKYLPKGAIVVCEVPTCQIRGIASFPKLQIDDIKSALKNENSPLLNRAILPYNLGSVFKLVTAVAALENGIDESFTIKCNGSILVEGSSFKCQNHPAGNMIDLKTAIAESCNSYFVELSKRLDSQSFYDMAKNLGFAQKIELLPGVFSADGSIPSVRSLQNPKTMANLSFGQGKLLSTPVQVAGLINAIASNGVYSTPQLLLGLVDENLDFTNRIIPVEAKKVFSTKNAQILKNAMQMAVEKGQAKKGMPECGGAGAKTGTAQTGILNQGKRMLQGWYAGYYPAQTPKYSIVIFQEDASKGGAGCGPAFKKICDEIHFNLE